MSYFDITIVSTAQPNWIELSFEEEYKTNTSVQIRKEQLVAVWCGPTMLSIPVLGGQMWSVSFDGIDGSHKIVSINGTVPTSNEELCTMIMGLRP